VKDPEPYLLDQDLKLPCPVHPDLPAILTSGLRERLNWEIYYFSSEAACEEFRKDPLRWCGLLTDPVDGTRFHPTAGSPKRTWNGRLYFFSSGKSREAFESSPEQYAERMGM